MKANSQSMATVLEIDGATGSYRSTSNFLRSSWITTNYALEYTVLSPVQAAIELRLPSADTAAKDSNTSISTGAEALPGKTVQTILTPRQRDVFDLIVQGMSNKEIARSLQLAEGTVKIHIKALFAKLGVRRRAAVAVAGNRLLASSERGSC
jgi:DNA-binding NarL/FixJ family response regulator